MSAPLLRFARVVANSVHENAPDCSMHTIQVGKLREAVGEMAELYEALKGVLALAKEEREIFFESNKQLSGKYKGQVIHRQELRDLARMDAAIGKAERALSKARGGSDR